MKRLIALSVLLLISSIAMITGFPASAPTSPFDPANHNVPDSVAGHKVLAVISSDTTKCVPSGLLTLVVRVSVPDPLSYPVSNEAREIRNAMKQFGNPHWTVKAIGPNVSLDNMQAETESWNQAMSDGCHTFSPAASVNDGDVILRLPGQPGRGMFEILEASMPNDTAVAGFLHAPAVGGNQNAYSGLMLNAKTNGPGDNFFQVGLDFDNNGNGYTFYTSDSYGTTAQFWAHTPYVEGHDYYVTISGTDGIWGWCMGDTADYASTYQCLDDYQSVAAGNELIPSLDTSIWFENFNTQKNWDIGFSSPVTAYSATICPAGLCQGLTSEHKHLLVAASCTTQYRKSLSTSKAVLGTMIGRNTGSFDLRYIPRLCQ